MANVACLSTKSKPYCDTDVCMIDGKTPCDHCLDSTMPEPKNRPTEEQRRRVPEYQSSRVPTPTEKIPPPECVPKIYVERDVGEHEVVGERAAKKYFSYCRKDLRRLPKLKCAERYRLPELKQLVGLCKILQDDQSKGDPFYLASIDAGEFLGISVRRAGRWLAKLEKDEVIRRHKTGTRHRANEYFFVGRI